MGVVKDKGLFIRQNMYTLQKLLAHESPLMTQRYTHLADEAMKRAAAVADSVLLPAKKSQG